MHVLTMELANFANMPIEEVQWHDLVTFDELCLSMLRVKHRDELRALHTARVAHHGDEDTVKEYVSQLAGDEKDLSPERNDIDKLMARLGGSF